jgi:Bacterial SH3 domain
LINRPRLQADAAGARDSDDEDIWSNAPVVKSISPSGVNRSSQHGAGRPPFTTATQPGNAANANRLAGLAGDSAARRGSADDGRDWLYDWDSPVAQDNDKTESRRPRIFIPPGTRAADFGAGGRRVARRLAISAACLALVAAGGFGWVMHSGHRLEAVAPVVAKVEQKKAPAVTAQAVAPAAGKQAEVKMASTAPAARPALTATATTPGPAIPQTAAAARAIAAKIPSPDSARWALSVSPSSDVTAGKPAKPTPSMAAFASADNKNPASVVPEQAAKAPDAAKPKADSSETASIPDEKDSAQRARATIEDVSRSAASKPVETGGSRAFVTTAAKLHAGPENHSHVIAVVPAKAAVELFSCTQWCKVAYDGHEGWIYKEFVGHSASAVPAIAHAVPAAKTKSKVASADSGKLIGGVVVSDGTVKPAAQPSAPAAAPQATQPAPAAAEPATMMHNPR